MDSPDTIRDCFAIHRRSPHAASLSLDKAHASSSSSSDGYVLSPTPSDPETLVIDTCGIDIYSAPTDELYNPRGYRPPGPVERAYQTGRVLVEEIGATAGRTVSGVGREELVEGWRTAWGVVRRRVVGEVRVVEQWTGRVRAANGGPETEEVEPGGLLDESTPEVMVWAPDSAPLDEHQGEQETSDDGSFTYGEIARDDAQEQLLMSLHSLAPHPSHHTARYDWQHPRNPLGISITAGDRRELLMSWREPRVYCKGDDDF
jgi:hypothetical protein